jgi:hypothetical protein
VAARLGQAGDEQYFDEQSLQIATRKREATPFFYVMALVTDAVIDAGRIAEKDGLDASEATVASVQRQLGTCGVASSTIKLGDVSMNFETGDDGWVSLTVEAGQ